MIDIGSNDGSLLRAFQAHGLRVLGVDPAVEIARQATAAGLETVPDFFTSSLAGEPSTRFGTPPVVLTAWEGVVALLVFTLSRLGTNDVSSMRVSCVRSVAIGVPAKPRASRFAPAIDHRVRRLHGR